MTMNSPYKPGIVLLNDYARGRSRVTFEDEDGTRSYWLRWNSPFTGKSKFYNAPDIGSQVNCMVDWQGEDGCIVGASYSEKDATPTSDGGLMKAMLEGGLDFSYNKSGGGLTIKTPGVLTLEASNIITKGNVDLNNGYVKNDGVSIDKTHGHVTAPPGPSGPPVS